MTDDDNGQAIDFDVVVVGAGMAGLYSLHRLRGLGYRVLVLEKGSGVGGTWFWNRYPGARCDVPSMEYSFGFDDALQQEWKWTEHFAPQPEIEAYLNHIADRYDLRRDIRLDTAVRAATFDESSDTWTIETASGERITARFCIMATGSLSAPARPELPGLDTFAGLVLQTSLWPRGQVDLADKRIGLIGTGSSGVQATPELAKIASHLTVFQRTPTFTWPSRNQPLSDEEQERIKAHYAEYREQQWAAHSLTAGTTGAVILQFATERKILDSTPEERAAVLGEFGFDACRVWADSASSLEANEMAVELFREAIRHTVHDPDTAEALSPRGYPLGCKRPVIDSGYFETFNRSNVSLVDLRRGGIEAVTPTGIQTAQGFVELDVIIFATGFDALTGALDRIDIRGCEGRLLRDEWAEGPHTYLGFAMAGFPNLFLLTGPGSPSVLANFPPQIEYQVNWLGDLFGFLASHGETRIEADLSAQSAWIEHVNAVAEGTMFTAASCNSWYNGQNIPGKPRVFMPYVGGYPAYMAKCDAVAAAGYEGFTRG